MKTTMKNRIISSFVILLVLTVFIFEIFSIYSVKYYYYSVVHDNLQNSIKYAMEIYKENFSGYSVEAALLENIDQYYKGIDGQIILTQ